MYNIMIDMESSGLDANKNAMIQLGAMGFDIEKQEVSEGFCECLLIPGNRAWDKDTREWWEKTNKNMMLDILKAGRSNEEVLKEFKEYVESFEVNVLFWSHHTIDWEFVNSYFKQYNIKNPFKYYNFRDISSYLEAFVPGDVKKYAPTYNEHFAHNALYDCQQQIQWIFNTVKWSKIVKGE